MSPEDITFPAYQGHTVSVSVINGSQSHMPAFMLVDPPFDGQKYLNLAGYSFLIASAHRQQNVLFDLAFMRNHERRMPPAVAAMFAGVPDLGGVDALNPVPDALRAAGLDLAAVHAIVWSHHHLDHIGDPAEFPPSTALVVGPGTRARCMPGYPVDPDGIVLSSAFEGGREVQELDFGSSNNDNDNTTTTTTTTPTLTIAGFPAIDFFADGSFFLLHAPGHTPHHLAALCRTTADSWVLLAGDAAHNVGQLRPSEFLPLPAEVPAEVLGRAPPPATCSCAHVDAALRRRRQQQQQQHQHQERGERSDDDGAGGAPVYGLAAGMHEELAAAEATLARLRALDAREDVLVLLAHDATVAGVLDFFPATINEWRAKGWAERGRWLFLKDLEAFVAP